LLRRRFVTEVVLQVDETLLRRGYVWKRFEQTKLCGNILNVRRLLKHGFGMVFTISKFVGEE
jgi:hypothetical protein